MKFIGTFVACFLLIFIAVAVFGEILFNIWGILVILALLMAIVIHALISFDDRLEAIEKQLGLRSESPTSFAEQLHDDNDKTAP